MKSAVLGGGKIINRPAEVETHILAELTGSPYPLTLIDHILSPRRSPLRIPICAFIALHSNVPLTTLCRTPGLHQGHALSWAGNHMRCHAFWLLKCPSFHIISSSWASPRLKIFLWKIPNLSATHLGHDVQRGLHFEVGSTH